MKFYTMEGLPEYYAGLKAVHRLKKCKMTLHLNLSEKTNCTPPGLTFRLPLLVAAPGKIVINSTPQLRIKQ